MCFRGSKRTAQSVDLVGCSARTLPVLLHLSPSPFLKHDRFSHDIVPSPIYGRSDAPVPDESRRIVSLYGCSTRIRVPIAVPGADSWICPSVSMNSIKIVASNCVPSALIVPVAWVFVVPKGVRPSCW